MDIAQIETILTLKYGSMRGAILTWAIAGKEPTNDAEQEEIELINYWWEHATEAQKDYVSIFKWINLWELGRLSNKYWTPVKRSIYSKAPEGALFWSVTML